MRLNDCMTRGVQCTGPGASLQEAATKMRDLDIGTLPVCGDDGRLMGIVTDRDIAVRAVAKGYNPKTAKVAEAMTPTVVYCYEDQELDDAVRIMEDKQIRRLLVLDRNKRLTGIISLADLAASSSERDLAAEALEAISEPTHRT